MLTVTGHGLPTIRIFCSIKLGGFVLFPKAWKRRCDRSDRINHFLGYAKARVTSFGNGCNGKDKLFPLK